MFGLAKIEQKFKRVQHTLIKLNFILYHFTHKRWKYKRKCSDKYNYKSYCGLKYIEDTPRTSRTSYLVEMSKGYNNCNELQTYTLDI